MPPFSSAALTPAPFWQTSDGQTARLWVGDAATVLRRLPAGSVHCVVTSPPYWGLRDYGTGTWTGGDAECDHVERKPEDAHKSSMLGSKRHLGITLPETNAAFKAAGRQFAARCRKCGARRIDQQLGSEPSPDCGTHGQAQCGRCFVCVMVAVFREVRRVLRDDGTLWLNLGDSYASGGRSTWRSGASQNKGYQVQDDKPRPDAGIPDGNLVGVPWRVALALQADGWILRQDVIWHKPAPMPESVRNRCTKAHEYVFLLAKRAGYFYDAEAIREKAEYHRPAVNGRKETPKYKELQPSDTLSQVATHRNKRSVWSVSSQGYPGAHFATFPPKLIEPMIKAGTSERGCCAKCGAPWRRVTEETRLRRSRPNDYVKRTGAAGTGNSCANTVAGVEVRTVGWEPSGTCVADIVPCTVLDPFVGSGTAAAVAVGLGRRGWGIDLSEDYLRRFAVPRVGGVLLARPALAHLAAPGGGVREVSGGPSETAAAGPVEADGEGWF